MWKTKENRNLVICDINVNKDDWHKVISELPCASVSKRVPARIKPFIWKMRFMAMNLKAEQIFIWIVSHEDSFWHRGNRQPKKGLLRQLHTKSSTNKKKWVKKKLMGNKRQMQSTIHSTITRTLNHRRKSVENRRPWEKPVNLDVEILVGK